MDRSVLECISINAWLDNENANAAAAMMPATPIVRGYSTSEFGAPRPIIFDASALKFTNEDVIRPGPVRFDLNRGIESIPPHSGKIMEYDHLYEHILDSQATFSDLLRPAKSVMDALLVSHRGDIKYLVIAPYIKEMNWSMLFTLHGGVLYNKLVSTISNKEVWTPKTPEQQKLSSYGYRFYDFILSGQLGVEPNPQTSTLGRQRDEFSLILNTQLGAHNILITAKTDGLCTLKPPPTDDRVQMMEYLQQNLDNFIVVHTVKPTPRLPFHWETRRKRLTEWWASLVLQGAGRLVLGERNREGIIQKLLSYNVNTLPNAIRECEEKAGGWRSRSPPKVSTNAAAALLTMVKSCMQREVPVGADLATLPPITLRVEKEGQRVSVLRHEPREGEPEHAIPPHYIENFIIPGAGV